MSAYLSQPDLGQDYEGSAQENANVFQVIKGSAEAVCRHSADRAVAVAACGFLSLFAREQSCEPLRWWLDAPATASVVKELSAAMSAALLVAGDARPVRIFAKYWFGRLCDTVKGASGGDAAAREVLRAALAAVPVAVTALRVSAAGSTTSEAGLTHCAIRYLSMVFDSGHPSASARQLAAAGAIEAIIGAIFAAPQCMYHDSVTIIAYALFSGMLRDVGSCPQRAALLAQSTVGGACHTFLAALLRSCCWPESYAAACGALQTLNPDGCPESCRAAVARDLTTVVRGAFRALVEGDDQGPAQVAPMASAADAERPAPGPGSPPTSQAPQKHFVQEALQGGATGHAQAPQVGGEASPAVAVADADAATAAAALARAPDDPCVRLCAVDVLRRAQIETDVETGRVVVVHPTWRSLLPLAVAAARAPARNPSEGLPYGDRLAFHGLFWLVVNLGAESAAADVRAAAIEAGAVEAVLAALALASEAEAEREAFEPACAALTLLLFNDASSGAGAPPEPAPPDPAAVARASAAGALGAVVTALSDAVSRGGNSGDGPGTDVVFKVECLVNALVVLCSNTPAQLRAADALGAAKPLAALASVSRWGPVAENASALVAKIRATVRHARRG